MLDWFILLLLFISDLTKPCSVVGAEITSLRHQVITLKGQTHKIITLRRNDRLLLTFVFRFIPEAKEHDPCCRNWYMQ
jgi:hypothetical protein